MADDSRDVLMKIVLNGTAIPAECSAAVSSNDTLAGGFTTASSANQWKGNYFSVQDFQMEVGLLGDSPGTEAQRYEAVQEQIKLLREAQKNGSEGKPLMSGSSAGEYSRFMNNGASAIRAKSYSANLEPVSITKMMDASSLTLFNACITSTTLDSAVLIKRRGGGAEHLRTYLRIEFTNLLITDFNWDEDDVVKEKIKFVCREANVQYSKENDDGTLQNAGQARKWSALDLKKR
jgi:type VI protein secretion system component Hcp